MSATGKTAVIHDISDALRFITASSNLFQNGDSLAEEAALDALQSGREAYWSKGVYSNQRASRLLTVANRSGLGFAIGAVADDNSGTHAGRVPYLLGTLIPLNPAAMVALETAWADWADAPRERNARVAEPFRSTLNAVGL